GMARRRRGNLQQPAAAHQRDRVAPRQERVPGPERLLAPLRKRADAVIHVLRDERWRRRLGRGGDTATERRALGRAYAGARGDFAGGGRQVVRRARAYETRPPPLVAPHPASRSGLIAQRAEQRVARLAHIARLKALQSLDREQPSIERRAAQD